MTRMAEFRQVRPRERLGAYLRRRYPHANRDKRLAHELHLTPRAARNLFEDHWPGDATWAAIVRRFGADVLRAVFAPEIDPVLADLADRERRLEEELERTRAHRRQVAGGESGVAPHVAVASPPGR